MTIKMYSSKYLFFIFAQSLVFTILYNSHLFNAHGVGAFLCPFFSFTNMYLFFYILFLYPRLSILLVPFIYISSSIGSYFQNISKIDIDSESVAFLFETHLEEAREFLNINFIFWIFISIILSLFFIYFAQKKLFKKPCTKASIIVISIAAIINFGVLNTKWFRHIVPDITDSMRYHNLFPVNIFKATKSYAHESYRIAKTGRKDSSSIPSKKYFNDDQLTIIFVIGESARADHFQLNGYLRPTTPLLAQEANVISYKHTTSFAASTRRSVPIIITPSDTRDTEIIYSSFLDIFNKHNFTTSWISQNDTRGNSNSLTTKLAESAHKTFFKEELGTNYTLARDEQLLPFLDLEITDFSPLKFIVLHTRGSHYDYKNRYSEKFIQFIPDRGNNKPLEELKNAYDNSILATDSFLYSIISKIKDRNAVMIYVSDHGESLGEDGYHHHGNDDRLEQRQVPFIIWCSNSYISQHPKIFSQLKKNAGMKISHDYIFSTTLHVGGISSQLGRIELDLASNKTESGHGHFFMQ